MTFDPMSVEVTCVTQPKDHCVQVPWEYINVCGYNDQFCKIPHTTHKHTTYILYTYYVQNEWSHSRFLNTFRRDNKKQGPVWVVFLAINPWNVVLLSASFIRGCFSFTECEPHMKQHKLITIRDMANKIRTFLFWSSVENMSESVTFSQPQ